MNENCPEPILKKFIEGLQQQSSTLQIKTVIYQPA